MIIQSAILSLYSTKKIKAQNQSIFHHKSQSTSHIDFDQLVKCKNTLNANWIEDRNKLKIALKTAIRLRVFEKSD